MLLWILSGCCRDVVSPILDEPQVRVADNGEQLQYALDSLLIDSTLPLEELQFSVQSSDPSVEASIENGLLSLRAPQDNGEATIDLTVVDSCEATTTISFDVQIGDGLLEDNECYTQFSYVPESVANAVYVAGSFNDWNTESHPLTLQDDGSWEARFPMEEGAYSYKFIVQNSTEQQWTCDPSSDLFQCDSGQPFQNDCTLGVSSCNSVLVVENCNAPSIEFTSFDQQNDTVTIGAQSTGAEQIEITLNGQVVLEESWDGSPQQWTLELSQRDRHLLQASAIDSAGRRSPVAQAPFWTDDFDWDSAIMYFVFVDRFFNGDPSNDESYDANWQTGDYLGGDWQGVIDKLEYLHNLGVNVLWLTAPNNNPNGLYDGDCGMTITGYHGYWPVSQTEYEEHFGTEELFDLLVEEAHNYGMRVLVDWVGNHTHDEHPWVTENPDWYTDYHLCRENDNWNQAPETCWFAPYVPSFNYYRTDTIMASVNDAIALAKRSNIDGFRVDAVKHMPMSVHHNAQSRIEAELEHRSIGGTMEFYTVGETFSGDRGLLNSYIGETLLDGQFDFSIYWTLLSVIARDEQPMHVLEQEYQTSKEVYGNALMSNFLGNHDVERFISHAAGDVSSLYGDGLCPDGNWRGPASSPSWDEPYQRLQLAWTWLLTHGGTALVYYGDEIGLPGYHDPDNRQMMKWDLSQAEAAVHNHVSVLGQARQLYPQLTKATPLLWWGESDNDVLVYALSYEGEHALVALNRSGYERSFGNTLSWAGLPSAGNIINIFDNQELNIDSDQLNLTLAPWESQVWIWQ